MKRVLILTASTGEGHNQAAKTLEVELNNSGFLCKRVDLFKSTNKAMDIIMSDGYKMMASSMPKMYGSLYHRTDHARFNPVVVKRVFKLTEYKVRKIAWDFNADLIIATHPFAVPIVGNLKKKGRLEVPFVQIVTDFRAHYAYVDDYVDAYITASDHAKADLVKRGINPSKIHPYGIPVKAEFMQKSSGNSIQSNQFKILVMGGSMGMKAMETVVESITSNKRDIFMYVICGNNKSLQNNLTKRFKNQIIQGKLMISGFVDNIPELMENSDIIITKPGGLTSSEAINKSIPMLIPFAIPGQEKENTDLLVKSGMAIEVKSAKDVNDYINDLMDHPEKHRKMILRMSNFAQGFSMYKIVELMKKMTHTTNKTHRAHLVQGIESDSFDYVQ